MLDIKRNMNAPLCPSLCCMVVKEAEKMADENEDQWLYGDSTDGKEYASTNIQSEVQQNDSMLINIQDKSQEDQQVEGTNGTSSEVRDITCLVSTILRKVIFRKML